MHKQIDKADVTQSKRYKSVGYKKAHRTSPQKLIILSNQSAEQIPTINKTKSKKSKNKPTKKSKK